jgi:dihydrofolate reductase
MRKLIVLTFVTLDGVMQGPGGPEEDVDGGFKNGGWSVGYWDDVLAKTMGEQMGHDFHLLLGRRTYDVFAGAWPSIDAGNAINSTRKYVVTHRDVPADSGVWKNSVRVDGDIPARIRQLKQESGPELQVHGSVSLVQTLLEHDLVDELWLKIYPVTLGKGKRLFGNGTAVAGWELLKSEVTSSGVIVVSYRRAGAVKSGTFAP